MSLTLSQYYLIIKLSKILYRSFKDLPKLTRVFYS